MCNDSAVEFDEQKMRFKAVGEPTEAALQVLVEKLGLPANADIVFLNVVEFSVGYASCEQYEAESIAAMPDRHSVLERSLRHSRDSGVYSLSQVHVGDLCS